MFLSLKIVNILTNSADTYEMPPFFKAAFHLGLHCLPKYLCTSEEETMDTSIGLDKEIL